MVCPTRHVHQAAEQEKHQHKLDFEPEERRQMEPERVQSAPQPVVDRQRRGRDRPINGEIRLRAQQRSIGEKARHIADVADVDVVSDRMEIIKVKIVVEVVDVGRPYDYDQGRAQDQRAFLIAGQFREKGSDHLGLCSRAHWRLFLAAW